MSGEYRKKLIEVALPLQAINLESAREKSIRHGHPSTLHLWWSRKPLSTCRAVLFASLVDDPSARPEEFPTEEAQEGERQRLFRIIEQLVKWENSNNETVLATARAEIMKSTNGNPPPVLDPFCGGGSVPLEAQRLRLEAYGADLNPVAVLITKALIEIPSKFANQPPVRAEARMARFAHEWKGAPGLASDVCYYAQWMRDETEKRIGHLYPRVRLTKEHGGGEATVIAWLWSRSVQCPNPACGTQMPLSSKWWLSTKRGKEAWVEPVFDWSVTPAAIGFEVRHGGKPSINGTVNRSGAVCIACGTPVSFDYIRAEGKARRMGQQLLATVAEGRRGRAYVSPTPEQIRGAVDCTSTPIPEAELVSGPGWIAPPRYGMKRFADLFTPRQLVALTTFSDLVAETRLRVLADARAVGLPDDRLALNEGGTGAQAYADAVATYLGLIVDRTVDRSSTICSWDSSPKMEALRNTFSRQALQMT